MPISDCDLKRIVITNPCISIEAFNEIREDMYEGMVDFDRKIHNFCQAQRGLPEVSSEDYKPSWIKSIEWLEINKEKL